MATVFLYIKNHEAGAMIDSEDYPRCSLYSWSANKGKSQIHARVNGIVTALSSFIMKDSTKLWDHKDRNFANNIKDNLRIATYSQNSMNTSKHRDSKSQYKGVSYNKEKDKYEAKIYINKKTQHLGRYNTEKAAAIAYNYAARQYFGEFAVINKISI